MVHFLFFLLLAGRPGEAALIPAGTPVEARLESAVRTASSNVGDAVVAVITRAVRAAGGDVVPEGSRLNGRVETLSPATDTDQGRVRLAFREIQFPDGRRVPAWITQAFSASPPRDKLKYALYMVTGAAAGALIGGKSARTAGVIGGTLAGYLLAAESANAKRPDLTLKRGRTLHLKLGEDLMLE